MFAIKRETQKIKNNPPPKNKNPDYATACFKSRNFPFRQCCGVCCAVGEIYIISFHTVASTPNIQLLLCGGGGEAGGAGGPVLQAGRQVCGLHCKGRETAAALPALALLYPRPYTPRHQVSSFFKLAKFFLIYDLTFGIVFLVEGTRGGAEAVPTGMFSGRWMRGWDRSCTRSNS